MLLEVVSGTIRRKHYSDRTEKATFNRYSAYIQLDRPAYSFRGPIPIVYWGDGAAIGLFIGK
jgi:hypothetical protein